MLNRQTTRTTIRGGLNNRRVSKVDIQAIQQSNSRTLDKVYDVQRVIGYGSKSWVFSGCNNGGESSREFAIKIVKCASGSNSEEVNDIK